MKIKLALLAAMIIGGFVAQAWASCPVGTTYSCQQGYNGKVICGCH